MHEYPLLYYTYDSKAGLATVSKNNLTVEKTTLSKIIIYHLNANNQRVAKEVNGVIVEKYLWANLTTLLAIYDKDDNLLQRYNYTDQRTPTSMIMQNETYYLHYDQVGTLKAVTPKFKSEVQLLS